MTANITLEAVLQLTDALNRHAEAMGRFVALMEQGRVHVHVDIHDKPEETTAPVETAAEPEPKPEPKKKAAKKAKPEPKQEPAPQPEPEADHSREAAEDKIKQLVKAGDKEGVKRSLAAVESARLSDAPDWALPDLHAALDYQIRQGAV